MDPFMNFDNQKSYRFGNSSEQPEEQELDIDWKILFDDKFEI